MRARALLFSLVAVALGGCEAPPANPSPRRERIAVTSRLLDAFAAAIRAQYEVQVHAEPGFPFQGPAGKEIAAANEAADQARLRLQEALVEAGSHEARKSADLKNLLPIAKGAIHGGKYEVLVEPDGKSSLAVLKLEHPPESRELTVRGEKWIYVVHHHEETILEDYSTYRARRLAPPGARILARPAITLGRDIYLDLAAASEIGRSLFFPRVEEYRALTAAALAKDEPFAACGGDLTKLLALAKDTLRWRSLETFWLKVQNRPAADQARAFAEDYADREEIRAACEAFELEKARAAGVERPSEDVLQALEKRIYLEAIVLGEPLGHVATIVGLASDFTAKRAGSLDPVLEARLKAATSVTIALTRKLGAPRAGALTPEEEAKQDAKDVARLARATPDDLQAAARGVLEELLGRSR